MNATKSIKQGATVNIISKYSVVIIQLVINAILARYISPAEYGVVAIITVFTTFFNIFSDMGISTGIIQYKNLTKEDYNNIFSFSAYLGIAIALVFILFSIVIVNVYSDAAYFYLGIIISFSIFFNTINAVPQGLLMKEQLFTLIGLRTIIVAFLSGGVTIILAMNNFSYYSIAINSVINSFFIFIWNQSFMKLKFRFRFNLNALKVVFSFSAFQFLFSFTTYFTRNLDNLIIGKLMGSSALGLYDKSYKLTTYSLSTVPGIISPILHTVLSNYQNNKKKIYTQYLTIVRILTFSAAYIQPLFFFAATEIILIMFGADWIDSITSFKFLSLSLFSQFACTITGSVFQSMGKTKIMFFQSIITTSITVSCILLGVLYGNINSVSFLVMIAFNLHFIVIYTILVKYVFNYNLFNFILKIMPSFIILIINMIISCTIKIDMNSIILSLVIKSTILAIPTLVTALFLYKNKYFSVIDSEGDN